MMRDILPTRSITSRDHDGLFFDVVGEQCDAMSAVGELLVLITISKW